MKKINQALYSPVIIGKPLSSAEASYCCGEAGEKEKESARGYFSIIAISIGIPSGSPRGGER